MKPIKNLVLLVTAFVFVFAVLIGFGAGFNLMFPLFMIGNIMIIYMVYAVLKFGIPPEKTFDEGYWYSDIEYKHGIGENDG